MVVGRGGKWDWGKIMKRENMGGKIEMKGKGEGEKDERLNNFCVEGDFAPSVVPNIVREKIMG